MTQSLRDHIRTPGIIVSARHAGAAGDARTDEIATISHELRNSLAVIRNAAQLLRAPANATQVDRARVLIDRHVVQIDRHVGDLLEATSHPIGKKRTLYRSHVDLRAIVQNSVSGIAPLIAQRGHRLATHLPDETLWVHGDAARLEQVFMNLLINAAKFTPRDGDISISVRREGAKASIAVRDSGIGMDSGTLARVFELYSQANPASHCGVGSGIGLAVVRDHVEKHGGTVSAVSAGLELGSEFTVLLPLMLGSSP